jgi:enoyl-CoA hydratase/carnithine racemase
MTEPATRLAPLDAVNHESQPLVQRNLDGAVAVLTMQHFPHNLLGMGLMTALLDSLTWAQGSGARAVVIRSGLRHFSAGAELGEFATVEQGRAPDLPLVEFLRAFDELPLPIVASVNGICIGGGFEIALACDLIVAAASAKIGSVESALGVVPLMGGTPRVAQRAGAARAKEMGMLGRRFDAQTLERWNIINRVVPDEQLLPATMALAEELANGPTVAIASVKALTSIAVSRGVAAADAAMAEVQADIWQSQDLKTGIASLLTDGPGRARFEGR